MSGTPRSAHPGAPGPGRAEPGFIPVDELAALVLRQVPVLLIDARFTLEDGPLPDEYRAGHIPGAIFVDLERELAGPRTPSIGNYPVPESGAFERTARRWGLGEATDVVVYTGYKGISAGRLSWLLRWFGHERVRILDGGLQAWERRGYPLTAGESAPSRTGNFTASPGGLPVIDAGGALELGREGQLVDARSRSQYRLKVPDPARGGRLPGRIPGAVNIPSTSLHHRNGLVRTAEDITGLLRAEGVDPGRPVGVYCGGGVASAWAAFTLRAAGVDASFFTGAWAEYVADPALPVELEP